MTTLNIPDTYKCAKCKATDKKLWRDPQAIDFGLTCYNCSGETRMISEDGYVPCPWRADRKTRILKGNRIPAFPIFDVSVEAYWGEKHFLTKREEEWWSNLQSK